MSEWTDEYDEDLYMPEAAKLGERLVHSVSRAGVYSCPPMKHPVHGCFAAATQLCNLIN